MNAQRRAPRFMKISQVKNALSRIVNGAHQDGDRVVIEKNGIPIAAIVSFSDLRKLVHYERMHPDQADEDPFAVIDRMREAFKDVPDEEIEREADRAVAEIRGKVTEPQERERRYEDFRALIDRAREAFKDVPPEEIEQETDRIIARIRAENRAAREALAATG